MHFRLQTSDLHSLLLDLERLGVKLTPERGRLLFHAPEGLMCEELRQRISVHKCALLALMEPAMRLATDGASWPISDDNLPLTPHHAWYLNTFEPERHDWSITLALDIPGRISPERLRAAVSRVLHRHDVFRLRMRQAPGGRWTLRMLEHVGDAELVVHDMEGMTPDARASARSATGLQLHSQLSIVYGPVLALALCRSGHDKGDTVIVSMHHHAVDGYSVNLLLDDLFRAYHESEADAVREGAASCASYRDFLLRLHGYTHTPTFVARALSFWRSAKRLLPVAPLRVDMPGGCHTDLNSRAVSISLERDFLRKLTRIGAQHKLQLNDVLLTALAHTYTLWSGGRPLRLDVEHNGRSGVIPGLNLVRTIGPTTVKFPLLLEVAPGDTLTESLERLGEQIRHTTDNLLGYGMLRYTCPDTHIANQMAACPPAQVFFNNRATLTGFGGSAASPIAARGVAFPQQRTRENPISYDLLIECDRLNEALVLKWIYSSAIHREDSIRTLVQGFTEWLRDLTTADAAVGKHRG